MQLSFCFFQYWFAIRTSKSTKVLGWLATEHIIELHHHATHEPGLFETTRAELILCWKTQSLSSAMNQGPRFQHEASYPQSSASCPRGRSSQMVSNISFHIEKMSKNVACIRSSGTYGTATSAIRMMRPF